MNQPRFLEVTDATQAAALINRANYAKSVLPDSDGAFIRSILDQHDKKVTRANPMQRLSGAQWYWLNVKAEKAEAQNTTVVEREKVEIGELKGIIRLFDKAKQHLKKPAVVVAMRAEDGEIALVRLKPASPNGRVPNSIDVTEEGTWLGRIHNDGNFELSSREKFAARRVAPGIRAFAADPITGAKESARLTGRCSFCNTALKDERSTRVGYGKTCASRYELPWG